MYIYHNIKIIRKSTNRLSSFFRSKDVIPKELQSHLVYNFSCHNHNVTYYNKTERHLNVRSSEHIGISHLTGKRVACKPSAVLDHLLLITMTATLMISLSYVDIIMVSDF